jgi:hypothetical protein
LTIDYERGEHEQDVHHKASEVARQRRLDLCRHARLAKFFATKGLAKVRGTIDGCPFESSFMALGDGTHKLPVKADIRKRIGKEEGDIVTVLLKERL